MADIRSPIHPAKKGEQPPLSWARWVETSIRRLQGNQPLPYRPIFPGPQEKTEAFWTEISEVPDSPGDFQVTITPGFLTYQNAGATEYEQGVTGYITPKIDGIAIDADGVLPLPLPGVQSYVYLRVKTDADGIPKDDGESVTIEAFDGPQQSIHHVRPSPSGGEEEGDYYFLILETEGNGATPEAPQAKKRITGNRSIPNQLVEITNIGGKRELYQGYLPGPDDKHEFRTIEQIEADGEPIIKPLGEEEEEGETIKWKTVKEGDLGQINVRSDEGGNSIIVEGNGVNGSFEDPFGGRVDYYDGLVVSSTPSNITGANMNLEFRVATETVPGSGSWLLGSPTTVYFRNGLYLGLTVPDDPEGIEVLTQVAVSDVQSIS